MNLVKNTIVVPSTTPTPNQDSERVALFNEDGSAFSAGGGAGIQLYHLKYFDFADYASMTGAVFSSANLVKATPAQLPAAFDQSKIALHSVHPDLVDDTANTGGVARPDWFSTFGPGQLSYYFRMALQTSQAIDGQIGLSLDLASNAWGSLSYDFRDPIQTNTYISATASISGASGWVPVSKEWDEAEAGFTLSTNIAGTPAGAKLRILSLVVNFIPTA